MGMARMGGPLKNYVYTGSVDIPPENPEPYMTKGRYKVFQSWDFNTSEIKTWLDENCSGAWDYRWDETNEDDSMQVSILFEDETDAMAFRLTWL